MLEKYLTIKKEGTHEIIIDKSRFVCTIDRAESEQEAQAFILAVKKSNRDATHNCSAYLIGDHDQFQKASDDGEPSGTAGYPMLEILKKKQLKNVVTVVTRYFGGIKLGAGGLVRAYGNAVNETCSKIGIIERQLATIISIQIDYSQLGKIENFLTLENYQIADKQFAEKITLYVYVNQNDLTIFKEKMIEILNGRILFDEHGQQYREEEIL
ncbi:YigZ family protein [Listeria sp. PSOL-1]|uniref:YigZ family protein n=1 Tax=Listeria sp. PSOL-1 TaxID=1844999 RepID=UPI0013D660F9|nr:YigZ family protein [Listeria sp. PSOL-1]